MPGAGRGAMSYLAAPSRISSTTRLEVAPLPNRPRAQPLEHRRAAAPGAAVISTFVGCPDGARALVGHRLGDLLGRGQLAPGGRLGEGERGLALVGAGLDGAVSAWREHRTGRLARWGCGMSDEPAAQAARAPRAALRPPA